jgi:hypothetical protein
MADKQEGLKFICKVNQSISHHKGYIHATMVNRICIIQDVLLILGAGVHSRRIGDPLVHSKASGHRTRKKQILD